MNTIGIDHNLDRARIRKLLMIGLFASVLTGIGDFLLGYADSPAGSSLAASVMASAPNLTDWQMILAVCLASSGSFWRVSPASPSTGSWRMQRRSTKISA